MGLTTSYGRSPTVSISGERSVLPCNGRRMWVNLPLILRMQARRAKSRSAGAGMATTPGERRIRRKSEGRVSLVNVGWRSRSFWWMEFEFCEGECVRMKVGEGRLGLWESAGEGGDGPFLYSRAGFHSL